MVARIPEGWLDQVTVEAQRELLTTALAAGSTRSLEHIPIHMSFRFNWVIENWLVDIALKYRHPAEEVIEIIVQMGQYISQVYPRVLGYPRVPYFHGVFPVDYLQARAQAAGLRADQHMASIKNLVNRTENSLAKLGQGSFAEMEQKTKLEEDFTSHTFTSAGAPEDGEPPPLAELPPKPRQQAISGELVYYLFQACHQRQQSPQKLLSELAATARFLDHNFADQGVPSLREQLLIKVLAAEQCSLEIDKTLSALETQLVDIARPLRTMERLMLSMLLPMERTTP